MLLQVQAETLLEYQEIRVKLFCGRVCPEENVSWNFGLVLSSVPVGYSEVDVYFEFYYKFSF